MDGWMDEWMGGWVNKWTDGWVNGGQMDGLLPEVFPNSNRPLTLQEPAVTFLKCSHDHLRLRVLSAPPLWEPCSLQTGSPCWGLWLI